MLRDPFLMKKLLKNEICGTLNTEEKSKHAAQEKKKREGKRANAQNVNVLCIQTAPMFHQLQFVMCFFFFFKIQMYLVYINLLDIQSEVNFCL